MDKSVFGTKQMKEENDFIKNQYAWEYEVEQHRKRKFKEKFYFLGAFCGIMSLVISIMQFIR